MTCAPARSVTRPVLRYHGGKWRLAPWVMAHFPPHRVYVELFGGAGSVLMRKPRVHTEVYNDLDREVVGLFRVLRDREKAAELQRLLALTPYSRDEFERSYRRGRTDVERARRLIVRAYLGYGSDGATRDGVTGFGMRVRENTPAALEWSTYPELLPAFTARLQGVIIERRPAERLIQTLEAEDVLFYADPPYVRATRSVRGEHERNYRCEFRDADHRGLASQLRQSRGSVVLSGYPSALYDELYPDWACFSRAAMADGAKARTECLWMNDRAAAGLSQLRLPLPTPERSVTP